jgi:hypothetical protein
MTKTTILRRRLDKISPPRPAQPYTAPAPDPRTLESMRNYLAGRPVTPPGASGNVSKAMRAFLAEQQ